MRKIAYLTFIFTIAVSLAACSSGSGGSSSGKSTAAATSSDGGSGSKPASSGGPTIAYTIFRDFNAPEYPADGGPAKPIVLDAMKKDGITGIDYKVSMAYKDDYKTKLNMLASSGDLPDYFNVPDIQTLDRFADEGLIMPLDDLLKQAPNVMKLIKQRDLKTLSYKGKIYGLPVGYRPETFNGPNINGLVVRQDWLDNLGLKAPTTIDELHNVLQAFVNGDPDKDGKKDTLGLSATKTSYFNFIFGAYGVVPTFWVERGGKLKQGMVLPETKTVLALLQQWYKEGLIDPEFPIMETKQLQEKVISSKVGLFEDNAFDGDPKQPVTSSLLKAVPTAKLKVLAPPAGPNGLRGWPENAPAYNDIRAISSKAKDPQKLMQMINWSAGPGFNLVTYGIEGKDYTIANNGAKINMLVNSYSDLYKEGFSNPIRFIQVVDRRWMSDEAIQGMNITNDPKNIIQNQFWQSVPAMTDYPDLSGSNPKLWSEYFSKIVTGAWPVSKWDEFVQKYYQQGGKEIEDQVNQAWQKSKQQ